MGLNRKLGNLAQFLDSSASGAAITQTNSGLNVRFMDDSDIVGTPATGLSDSNQISNIINPTYITNKIKRPQTSRQTGALMQGNMPSIVPSVTNSKNIGSDSNRYKEIILDSSSNIFFGNLSLTSVLRSGTAIVTTVTPPPSRTENSKYTTLLLTTSGTTGTNTTITDNSGNSHTMTRNGDTTPTTFSPYRSGGYSTYFDGTGDYLSATTASALGSNDWTVEYWVYHDALANNDIHCAFGTYAPAFYYRSASSAFAFYHGGANVISSVTPVAETWYHLAFVHDTTANTVKAYINGNLEMTVSSYTSSISSTSLRIGDDTTSSWMHGYIRDLRISTAQVYTDNFTAPTEPLTSTSDTLLLTCNEPYVKDGSSNGTSITINGNAHSEAFGPYNRLPYTTSDHGGSYYHDGTGDTITTTGITAIGTSDFTLEGWVNVPSFANYRTICTTRASSNASTNIVLGINSSGQIYLYSNGFLITASIALTLNNWHHFAVVRSGSDSNNTKLYINGVLAGQQTVTNNYTDASFNVGGDSVDSYNFLGYTSDIRLVKSAVYTSAFTPPTTPLTAITDTEILLNGTESKIFDKSQVNKLKMFGDTAGSSTQVKNATTSVYFDGTGDYIEFDPSIVQVGTTSWTIEMWFYVTDLSSNRGLFQLGRTDGSMGAMILTTGSIRILESNVVSLASSSTTVTTNSWNHVAFTFDTSTNTGKIFINGTEDSNTYTKTDTFTEDSVLGYIGARYYSSAVQVPFIGYIEDFRATKGLVRYTSDFTPPTASLEG